MKRSFASQPPTDDEGKNFHQRLLKGDPTASAELAEAYLPGLLFKLQERHPRADHHQVVTAAHDAIVSLIKNPLSYNPDKLPLDKFLLMSAQGDLFNAFKKEFKHQKDRIAWNVVAEDGDGGNTLQRDDDPSLNLQSEELVQEILRRATNWSPVELQVLAMILEDHGSEEEIAAVVDFGNLSLEDRKREAKRVRDRVKARLRREGVPHE